MSTYTGKRLPPGRVPLLQQDTNGDGEEDAGPLPAEGPFGVRFDSGLA